MKKAIALISAALGFMGCNTDPAKEGPLLELRADAVEPAAKVKVSWSLDGVKTEKDGVVAGTLFNLGKTKVGTKVVFQVFNTQGAGSVRANILTDNCFRKTGSCLGAGCTASAEYVVMEADCINE